MRSHRTLVRVGVVLLVLAGCTGSEVDEGSPATPDVPSPRQVVPPTPTEAPTPTPTPPANPSVDGLEAVGRTGWGATLACPAGSLVQDGINELVDDPAMPVRADLDTVVDAIAAQFVEQYGADAPINTAHLYLVEDAALGNGASRYLGLAWSAADLDRVGAQVIAVYTTAGWRVRSLYGCAGVFG